MNTSVSIFLKKHMLDPDGISPSLIARDMLRSMRSGLSGNIIDMPMIPTFLKEMRNPPINKPVMVIDAGGTNYRCALATFTESGCELSHLFKAKLPGTEHPVSWEEFISFIADSLLPFADQTDTIGFCFSYNADITPDVDGIVHRIDKEVTVTGCKGKAVGASLSAALAERGFPGKRVLILNDTVAALLGGSSALDTSRFSDFIGMICGTGINTCAAAAYHDIGKLNLTGDGKMLINYESGCYAGVPGGDVDAAVDAASNIPGEKLMEKMCSGVYIGKICAEALKKASEDGLLSRELPSRIDSLKEKLGGSIADSWAQGIDNNGLFDDDSQLQIAADISKAIFQRSARCMAGVILATMLMNDTGKTPDRPMCVCAEGSLISRSKYFLPALESSLKEIANEEDARYAEIVVGNETTLPGAAAAALLN